MTIRLLAIVFCLSASTLITGRASAQVLAAEDHVVELSVISWTPTPELTLSTGALAGSTINDVDFVQEFGIEDTAFPEFRAVIGRKHKFRLSYAKVDYQADATIQRIFTFQGQTFSIGVPASAAITWDIWKVGYEWDFVSRQRGFFGLVADVQYNKIEASIDSVALASPAAVDTAAPVPTIGVIGHGYVAPMVAITGEFTGLKLSRNDFEATLFDFDINGTVSFGRHVGVQGGYRSLTVDYLVDLDSGDIKMRGPYIGWVLRF